MVLLSSDNRRGLVLFWCWQTLGQRSAHACLARGAAGQPAKPRVLFALWIAQPSAETLGLSACRRTLKQRVSSSVHFPKDLPVPSQASAVVC